MFIIFIQATLFNLITSISKPLLKASSVFLELLKLFQYSGSIFHNYYRFGQVPLNGNY